MSYIEWQSGPPISLEIDGVCLECQRFGPAPSDTPTIIVLHEGLGCVQLWRDFPERLSGLTGCGVFAYSRAGYGASAPAQLPRPLDFLTLEAIEVLPALIDVVGCRKVILFGHSDGASIAAIYAGSVSDQRVRGLVLLAPHFFTESVTLTAIKHLRHQYESGELRSRLARYHNNIDHTFNGWVDVWLNAGFRDWSIADTLDHFRIPVLAIQGQQDQYGSMEQLHELETRSPAPVTICVLKDCKHSPQIEKPDETLQAASEFITRLLTDENLLPELTAESIKRLSASLPLPGIKHLPGLTRSADHELLESVLERANTVTESGNYSLSLAWMYGIRLFNEGYYWEAHEVLESVWLEAAHNSREKYLVQTVIQIANARLKLELGQATAASKLSVRAIACVERAFPRAEGTRMGLRAPALGRLAEACHLPGENPQLELELESGAKSKAC